MVLAMLVALVMVLFPWLFRFQTPPILDLM